jgi:hypothetical protein
VLDRYQGKQDEEAAKTARDAVYTNQAANNEKFLKALMGLRASAAAPVPGQAGARQDDSAYMPGAN